MTGRWRQRTAAWLACGSLFAWAGGTQAAPAVREAELPPPDPAEEPGVARPRGEVPGPAELEARGAIIGKVEIVVQDIFDPTDPREDKALYRLANRLHVATKDSAVANQLLFAEGEPYRRQRLEETERLLRGRKYLNDAWVRAVAYDADTNRVDVVVVVRDVWTLNPGISYGRQGGRNKSSFEIEDQNFLGRGKNISLGRKKDFDRTSTILQYDDPQLFGSWWRLNLDYADADDGSTKAINLAHPFYSLDTRWAAGLYAYDSVGNYARFQEGQAVGAYREDRQVFEAYFGRSPGLRDGATHRWYAGFRYDETRFGTLAGQPLAGPLPQDRKLAYPFITWEYVEDAYRTDRNVDLIGRTEDLYFGTTLRATVGYAAGAFGADRSAWMLAAGGTHGAQLTKRQRLFVTASASSRQEAGEMRDGVLKAEARYFFEFNAYHRSYASLSYSAREQPDADRQLLLGADEGLRAYPLRYQDGTSQALLTLEHRVFTDWYPFRLVRVGGAVFFDAGRTWGRGVTGAEPLGMLKDIGLGLRLGNNRSGLGNVLHVDLSYALDRRPGVDGLQLTIETKERF